MTTKTKTGPTKMGLFGGRHGGLVAIACEYNGVAYHFWLNAAGLAPSDELLYKNPPNGTKMDDPEYFATLTLNQSGATGRVIIPEMLSAAKALMPAHRAMLAMEVLHQEAVSDDNKRRDAIERAAPAMLAALKVLTGSLTAGMLKTHGDAIGQALAAIDAAQPFSKEAVK